MIIEKNDIDSVEFNELMGLVENLIPRAHDFYTKGYNNAASDVKRELKKIMGKTHQLWREASEIRRQRIKDNKNGNRNS